MLKGNGQLIFAFTTNPSNELLTKTDMQIKKNVLIRLQRKKAKKKTFVKIFFLQKKILGFVRLSLIKLMIKNGQLFYLTFKKERSICFSY
jgi:hypothetical protein